MRKILLLSAALMAVLAGPALAQDRGDRGGDRGGGEHGGGRPAAAAPAPAARGPAAPAARGPAAAPAPQAAPANRAEAGRQSMQREQTQRAQFENRDRNAPHNDNNRPDANRGNGNRPDANRGYDNRGNNFGRNDNRPGNNGVRGRPNPSYSQYHRAFNAPHRYRGPSYRRPSGWYARRWTFGDFLPSLFWSSNYWINDFGSYGLMPPPPGAVWVRDGDDAILIDRYTGEVIQVEYDAFY